MAGKKTFVAGEVLLAQDVNDFLMDQSVMNFATSAARASAIPTPTEGMTSYISTTGTATIPQIETYTGSAWQTPYGLTQLANVSFTTAASVTIDNVFTSNYQNYALYLNYKGTNAQNLSLQLRAGGATTITQYYLSGSEVQNGSTTVTGFNTSNGTSFDRIGRTDTGNEGIVFVSLFSPNTASIRTLVNFHACDTLLNRIGGGFLNATTQYDGVIFTPGSGTITGNIRLYGLRNS
jgi:hypothetical protein